MKLVAKTLFGLEQVLAEELETLGGSNVSVGNRAVFFEGSPSCLYRVNLASRLALRILKPVKQFRAKNDDQLYRGIFDIPWIKMMSVDQTFAIDATVYGDTFKHSHFAALRAKDAIVDHFRTSTGDRPDIDTDHPDIRINLHVSHDRVNVSLDASGHSLEKRGYRVESNKAPMSEVLAAGILAISGWNGSTPLLDPMTGSGTIAIEAAMLASNTPPGIHRSFAFMKWADFDKETFEKVELELRESIKKPEVEIVARDHLSTSLTIAKRNASRAGVLEFIRFERKDFMKSDPAFESGFVVMNPPYGERMKDEFDPSMLSLYHDIGSRLKHHYPAHEAWVFSSNLPALKKLGFKPKAKVKLFNGPLEGRLDGFEIFSGKRD